MLYSRLSRSSQLRSTRILMSRFCARNFSRPCGAQVWALSEIATNPDISVDDLAKRLAIHLSTASNLVRKMAQAGAVTRQRIGEDQRVVRLRATKHGLAVLKRASEPAIGLLQRALLDLPGNRLMALPSELETLLTHVKHNGRRAPTTPIAEL